jgi:carbonic anhydrase
MTHGCGIGPNEALALLKEGNARYVCGKIDGPNRHKAQRTLTYETGQRPFAMIVACSDSRVPVELLFDRGVGDIFIIRVAGAVCGHSEAGSVEYGVEHLGIPLLVVLGHSHCGAVTAVVQGANPDGAVRSIIDRIAPAVAKTVAARPRLSGQRLVDECAKENVWLQIESLLSESRVVRNAVKEGTLDVVGAFYNIDHGDVSWMGRHPHEHEIIECV